METNDVRHEHLAPEMTFSVFAFSQVQCRACSFPQEHFAWAAQTQPCLEAWQHEAGGPTILETIRAIVLSDCNVNISSQIETGRGGVERFLLKK